MYGGFPKMVVPNNYWFNTKNDHFGVHRGYHRLRKHPYPWVRPVSNKSSLGRKFQSASWIRSAAKGVAAWACFVPQLVSSKFINSEHLGWCCCWSSFKLKIRSTGLNWMWKAVNRYSKLNVLRLCVKMKMQMTWNKHIQVCAGKNV